MSYRYLGAMLLAGLVAIACSSSDADETPPITIAPVGDVDAGGSTSTDGDASACITTPPVALTDFLNACTDGECVPFDNTRLPLYTPGQALPPIP